VAKVRQVEKEIHDEDEHRTKTKKPRLCYWYGSIAALR
jgi:hypothetical protein